MSDVKDFLNYALSHPSKDIWVVMKDYVSTANYPDLDEYKDVVHADEVQDQSKPNDNHTIYKDEVYVFSGTKRRDSKFVQELAKKGWKYYTYTSDEHVYKTDKVGTFVCLKGVLVDRPIPCITEVQLVDEYSEVVLPYFKYRGQFDVYNSKTKKFVCKSTEVTLKKPPHFTEVAFIKYSGADALSKRKNLNTYYVYINNEYSNVFRLSDDAYICQVKDLDFTIKSNNEH